MYTFIIYFETEICLNSHHIIPLRIDKNDACQYIFGFRAIGADGTKTCDSYPVFQFKIK